MSYLTIENIWLHVTLDEIVEWPTNAIQSVLVLASCSISVGELQYSPSERRRRESHREAELNRVTS